MQVKHIQIHFEYYYNHCSTSSAKFFNIVEITAPCGYTHVFDNSAVDETLNYTHY